MNAPDLLRAYLAKIQDPAAAAALFAEDGVVELPTVNARALGAEALMRGGMNRLAPAASRRQHDMPPILVARGIVGVNFRLAISSGLLERLAQRRRERSDHHAADHARPAPRRASSERNASVAGKTVIAL